MKPARSVIPIPLAASLFLFCSASLRAQFNPATGPADTQVSFIPDTTPHASGSFTVTRSSLQLTIQRPGKPNYTFNENDQLGATTGLSYAFVGTNGLLARFVQTDPVNVVLRLWFINMETFAVGQSAVSLINQQKFASESPNLIVTANSDLKVIFTRLITGSGSLLQASDVTLWRGDTGASLCGAGFLNIQPSDHFSSNVSGTNVSILLNGNSIANCALPIGDLTVSPNPVAFGQIISNATLTRTVTLNNPGTDSITVSNIAASQHFSVQNFSAFTLDPLSGPNHSKTLTLVFNPGGTVNSGFNETLAITRTPAVGASTITCTGSSVAPAPKIEVDHPTLDFATVNVGMSPTQTFRIKNTGQLDLVINSVGPPSDPVYTLTKPANFNMPFTIPAGGQTNNFTVRFAPTVEQNFLATVPVSSNDPNNNGNAAVTLSGRGHIPAAHFVLDPTVTNLNYGDLEAGYRFGKAVRIFNQGDLPLQFTVEVLGDNRYSFSQTPNVPGTGVRGQIVVSIPAGPINGPFNEQILRVTFDAQLPVASNLTGTLRISNIQNDPTPPAQPIDIALSGGMIAAKTLDVSLILDRSGSMSESMKVGTKIEALRNASHLFFNLLRDNVGDRAAIVQFNSNASTLKHITALPPGTRQDFIDVINSPQNMVPDDGTSIAAGLLNGFQELNDPSRQVRAALIVTDGKENEPAHVGGQDINLSNIQVPTGVAVHSLCLGTQANTDLARLADIGQRSGGSAQATDDTTQLGIFDVEKYFLKVATTITGGMTALDPVATIYPGQKQTWQVGLIPADKAATFVLLFKNGALPFQIVAPDNTHYPVGSPPNGFAQSYNISPNARVVRIQLPTTQPSLYAGIWEIQVIHGGKLEKYKGSERFTEATKEPVSYAVAVSVNSNLRMLPLLSPQPLRPGDPIGVTAFLSEEEVPVLGALVDVQIKFPNNTIWGTLHLFDDGQHKDGAANDGEYGGVFTATQQTGAYTLNFHASGQSGRGGVFVREDTLSQFVQSVKPPGGDGHDAGFEKCCTAVLRWLKLLVILIVITILVLIVFRRTLSR